MSQAQPLTRLRWLTPPLCSCSVTETWLNCSIGNAGYNVGGQQIVNETAPELFRTYLSVTVTVTSTETTRHCGTYNYIKSTLCASWGQETVPLSQTDGRDLQSWYTLPPDQRIAGKKYKIEGETVETYHQWLLYEDGQYFNLYVTIAYHNLEKWSEMHELARQCASELGCQVGYGCCEEAKQSLPGNLTPDVFAELVTSENPTGYRWRTYRTTNNGPKLKVQLYNYPIDTSSPLLSCYIVEAPCNGTVEIDAPEFGVWGTVTVGDSC